ncbi:MAG TPA: SdrD B-like domain-containing protein, partial [Saprospiraceae bacterium]|nr:SdrD B-like domain-containing protein [Saprospiraceae bacterium]
EFNLLSKTFNLVFSTDFGREYWLKQPGSARPVSQWLTSIAFTTDDFMVLGVTDRTGHTYCDPVYPLTGSYGDILMLWNDAGVWKLENKGVAGPRTGSGPFNFEGPGHGEFFGEDFWTVGPGLHPETSFGSVTVLNGTDQVISSVFDPIYESFAGGLHKYSTINGKKLSAIQLYNKTSSSYGKASGLGDLTTGNASLPVEIGNLAWIDENENGIQDPGEKAMAGLQLSLFDAQCRKVGETYTDQNGNYLFNSGNVDSDGDGVNDGLKLLEPYFLVITDSRIDLSTGHLVTVGDSLAITKQLAGPEDKLRDSDGEIGDGNLCPSWNGVPGIRILTGTSGQNDYSFDLGFIRLKPTEVPEPEKIYDLALIKKVSGYTQPVAGDLVSFDLIIQNQGNQTVHQIVVTDYVKDYFSFESAANPGWTFSNGIARYALNQPLGAGQERLVSLSLRLNKTSRPTEIINAAEISQMRDSLGQLLSDTDSTPDEIENNDKGGVPNTETDNVLDNNAIDEDDHDRESLPIVDLALINRPVQTLPVKVNESAAFEMTVTNQGNVAVGRYEVVNYIPAGMIFDAGSNPGWTVLGNKAYRTINQLLQPGASQTIQIFLIIKNRNQAEWIDLAEIRAMWDAQGNLLQDYDSTPDQDPLNDAGGIVATATDDVWSGDGTVDEDDHDPATLTQLDLALIMTTDETKPVVKNQDVLFHITVCNQGSVSVSKVGITNYLPAGLVLSPLDQHGWFAMGGVLQNSIHANILPGGCATIDILLRVKESAKPGDLVNRAEIISVYGLDQSDLSQRDMDSKPDFNMLNDAGGVPGSLTDNMVSGDGLLDEDDADPASLFIMDLALIKRYVGNGSLQYGGQAEFVIQVLNQGSSAVSKVEISDYMPGGFALSATSVAAGWQQSGNILSFSYIGTLASGQETQILLVLDQVSELDMDQLINRAEISAVAGVSGVDWSDRDFDSKADTDPLNDAGGVPNTFTDNVVDLDAAVDEDDADPAGIPVFDLALRKQLVDKKLAYRIGDTVSYNIEVFNQGNVIAKDIEIADYLHEHYLFIPELNPEWVEIEEGIYSYSVPGSLNPSESRSARMHLVITELDEGNFIPNFAEIAFARDQVGNPGDDYDSVFDRIKDNDKGGEPRTAEDDLIGDHGEVDEDDHDGAESNPVNFDLALVKDVLQDVVKAGEIVQYTITVYNQGLVPAQEIELVEYVPAGLVLDDPDWNIGSSDPEMTKAYYLMNEQNGRLPAGGLKSGEQVQVKLDLRVAADQLPGILVNRAEIFRAENYGHVVDDDSQPDDDLINDPGGVVFEDSDGSSADPEPGSSDDEDDADPAGIIVVDIERTNPCQCLNNATNSVNGQFMEELSFRSLSNDIWFIFDVDGLYDPFSAPPPAAPTPFVTGPGGYILNEIPLGDGTSIYFIQGLHVDALGFSIVLSNQYGVKLSTGVHKCFYNDPVVLKSQNSVCSGQTVRYEVKRIPDASYLWTLSGGGTILTDPQSAVIDVEWTGSTGSSHVLTVTVNHPDSCYNPLEIPVIIGSEAGPVSCLGSAQVSLSFNCQVQITPSMLLLGGPYDYKSYAVMVMNKDGSLVPNNILTYDHIGKSFTAKVINVCSGNSCWSTVSVEDKVRPTIVCLNDTIDCALMKSYLKPIINDNCDPDPERIILDEQIENTPCNPLYSKIVTRQYVAKDHSGNVSAPCVMQIFLKRIVLDSIVFPDSLSRRTFNPLICSHFAADSLGHPLPSVSGVPYYRGLPAWPNNDSKYCDYAASYEDIELPTGKDCVRKILRNWKFTIWYCTTFEQRNYIQLIEIVDNEAPTITCPYDITATTNAVSCNANVWIPMPKASDLCGTILRFDLHHPGGLIQDFQASYVNIPEGINILTFTVYDQCHNSNSCSFTVTVEDRTPPVAVCDRETVVTLDRFGEAWVPASVFDDGSYDDCHIRSFEVRRMNVQESCNEGELNFRDSIRFCCADVGNEVMVVFRVTDFHGNENSCMVRVEVQDKTIPHIYCPHDVTINCDYHYDLNDLSEFGFPTVSDNCTVTFRDSLDVQINQCREGYIDRIFIAGNGFGQDVCVQRITVVNPHPFEEKDITWPKDLDTTTCISNGLSPDLLPEVYGY